MKKYSNLDKIHALEEIKKTIGWQIICETLDDNIKDTVDKLKDRMFSDDVDDINLKDIIEINILNNKRKDRKELKNLPNTLIKIYQLKDGTKKDFDPYQ